MRKGACQLQRSLGGARRELRFADVLPWAILIAFELKDFLWQFFRSRLSGRRTDRSVGSLSILATGTAFKIPDYFLGLRLPGAAVIALELTSVVDAERRLAESTNDDEIVESNGTSRRKRERLVVRRVRPRLIRHCPLYS